MPRIFNLSDRRAFAALSWIVLVLVGCEGRSVVGGPPDAAVSDAPAPLDATRSDGGPCAAPGVWCDGACIDPRVSLAHCGACGVRCGAAQVCANGACDVRCPGGQVRCGDLCVSLGTDRAHCGACGHACGEAEVCSDGRCELQCGPRLARCGAIGDGGIGDAGVGFCADTRSDPAHCGACGHGCALGEVCDEGRCASRCPAGTTWCGGVCADLAGHRNHCGACGHGCGAGEACRAGACVPDCAPGQDRCGTACTDLRYDSRHCGRCGTACPAGQLCSDGACADTCATTALNCSGACRDVQTDNAHCGRCGNACPAGQRCEAGACGCAGGGALCAGACRDLQTDGAHCGRCGNVCPTGQVCAAGACALTCPSGLAACAGACRDVRNAATDCGRCGNACPTGQVCGAGACALRCPGGTTSCDGSCVDPGNDPQNCGRCGRVCGSLEVCRGGACALGCPTGQTACGATAFCVDTRADSFHCGRCGNACPTGQSCAAGACVTVCPTGTSPCGGVCRSLDSDNNHCGACGRACAADSVCRAGACERRCAPGETRCGDACANLLTDAANCGACGRVCAGGCDGGACARPVEVQASWHHACARYSNGRVSCWGHVGGIGPYPGTFHIGDPTPVYGVMGAPVVLQSMSLSYQGGCGVDTGGDVVCWGTPGGGLSRKIDGLRDVLQVDTSNNAYASADFVGCAVRSDLRVYCWGSNRYLTRGAPAVGTGAPSEPATAAAISNVRSVAVGGDHVCALSTGGDVSCWGYNDHGQLGLGDTSPHALPTPVAGMSDVVDLWAGQRTTCARKRDGAVWCWGRNLEGQLGDGTTTNRARPVEVAAWRGATALSLGYGVACAVIAGEVRCAGTDSTGALGLGAVAAALTPTRVAGLAGQRTVHVGVQLTCAMSEGAREVRCWGRDDYGGVGAHHESLGTPTAVRGISDAIDMAVGEFHVAILRRAGTVTSWGTVNGNSNGQLGAGPMAGAVTVPQDAVGLTDAVALTAGRRFTCVLRRGGTVACWGLNSSGQLGNGTTTDSNVPVAVAGLSGVVEVSSGYDYTCARRSAGDVWCWGDNSYGQMGNNTVLLDALTPVRVQRGPGDAAALDNVAQVSAGYYQACARRADRTVVCWGRNVDYELGTLVTTNSYVPLRTHAAPSTLAAPLYLGAVDRLFCRYTLGCNAFVGSGEVVSWGGSLATASALTRASIGGATRLSSCVYGLGAIGSDGGFYNTYTNEWGLRGSGTYNVNPTYPRVASYNPVLGGAATRIASPRRYVTGSALTGVLGAYAVNACAVGEDGVVDCWGYTPHGFLEPCGVDRYVRTPGNPVQL